MPGERRERQHVPAKLEERVRPFPEADERHSVPCHRLLPDQPPAPGGGPGREVADPAREPGVLQARGEAAHHDDLPVSARSASPTVGKASIASWFQTPVTATARLTAAAWKPHARSIAKDSAIPTATPAGAM